MLTVIVTIATLAVSAFAAPPTVSPMHVTYDPRYDNKAIQLNTLACAYEPFTRGFTTIGSLPTTNVGATAMIGAQHLTQCGTCWAFTYENVTVNVLAIDGTGSGFVVAESTLNALTGGRAVHLGSIDAGYKQVNASACGL